MGQGFEEALLFSTEGAKIVATDIVEEGLSKLKKKIEERGGEILTVVHDVSSEEDWKKVLKKTLDKFQKLDVLVNNAGIGSRNNVENETLDEWERVQKVNSRGTFLGMKYAAPEMRRNGGGSIINLSSVYGMIGVEGYAAYHASKGAVRVLTKSAAMEFAKSYIRVNSIHPGIIETPMTEDLFADDQTVEWLQSITPWPTTGRPLDVAYGALYLASDESTFVTGSELVIDGGWTAH